MAQTTNDQAISRYIALKGEIDDLLSSISQASADHFSVNPEEVNWAHVGTLAKIAELLREVKQFANIK